MTYSCLYESSPNVDGWCICFLVRMDERNEIFCTKIDKLLYLVSGGIIHCEHWLSWESTFCMGKSMNAVLHQWQLFETDQKYYSLQVSGGRWVTSPCKRHHLLCSASFLIFTADPLFILRAWSVRFSLMHWNSIHFQSFCVDPFTATWHIIFIKINSVILLDYAALFFLMEGRCLHYCMCPFIICRQLPYQLSFFNFEMSAQLSQSLECYLWL